MQISRSYFPVTNITARMSSWHRMLKQSQYEVVYDTPTAALVKLQEGLSFRGLDLQTGLAYPFEVFRTLYQGQAVVTFNPKSNFLDFPVLQKNNDLLMMNTELNIKKEFYSFDLPKYPAEVETRLNSFRNSTFLANITLKVSGCPDSTASIAMNTICVAKNTKTPNPFPDWWREKYQCFSGRTSGLFFKPLVRPDVLVLQGVSVKPYMYTVPKREMDWNGHVNAVFYLRYCLDALEHHLYTNSIDCDINVASLLLKTTTFVYKGYSKTGDTLAISFWDDVENPDTVCFDITKSGQSIYQSRMQFYGRSEVPHCKL